MQVRPWRMVCPQCGAPLEIEPGHVLTICRYCDSQLYIGELSDRPVTRVKVRPALSQLEQECAYVRSQLASVEAEIGSLKRQPQTDTTWQQLGTLRAQERVLRQRLAALLSSDSSVAEAANASRQGRMSDQVQVMGSPGVDQRFQRQPLTSVSPRAQNIANLSAQLARVRKEIEVLERQPESRTTIRRLNSLRAFFLAKVEDRTVQGQAAVQRLDSLRVQERTLKVRLQSWQNDGASASVAKAPPVHHHNALKTGCLLGLAALSALMLCALLIAPEIGTVLLALVVLGLWILYGIKFYGE